MAYAVKTVLDTWLKGSTAQGSALPDDQKQFVNSGMTLPISGFEVVDTEYLKLTLGLDKQGKQLFFKGKNTWYVYRPAVQILKDGQATNAAPPATKPVCTMKAVLDTWLKTSTGQGSTLPADQKQLIGVNTLLSLESYALVENDHIKLTLGLDAQGNQVQFKGRNSWYVYRPAVQIFKDGKVVNLTPAPAPAADANPFGKPDRSATKTINAKGLRLLKSFEGLRLDAYIDAVGVLTIGYGTTTGVTPGMRITEAEAEAFLKRDLAKFEAAIANLVKVSLNDDQFSALVTFTYNVGEYALANSTLLRLLNQGDLQGAADQFLRWNRGDNGELPGLTRRRKAERSLFLGKDYTAFL
jgi:GH24 family phage-related lysozyme (muramidase)